MERKGTIVLLFVISFILAPFLTGDAFAERSVVIWTDQGPRCVSYSDRGKEPNAKYEMMRVTVRKPDIAGYTYDNQRAVICFQPIRIGTTRVIVNVKKYEYDSIGRLKATRNLTRRYRVKIRNR